MRSSAGGSANRALRLDNQSMIERVPIAGLMPWTRRKTPGESLSGRSRQPGAFLMNVPSDRRAIAFAKFPGLIHEAVRGFRKMTGHVAVTTLGVPSADTRTCGLNCRNSNENISMRTLTQYAATFKWLL